MGQQNAFKCPYCEGLWLPEALVRQLLGGKTFNKQLVENPSSKPLRFCPQDQTSLTPCLHQEIQLDRCPMCQGLWMDKGEFQSVKASLHIPNEYSGRKKRMATKQPNTAFQNYSLAETITSVIVYLFDGL